MRGGAALLAIDMPSATKLICHSVASDVCKPSPFKPSDSAAILVARGKPVESPLVEES
jgi:hypothetical protein